MYPDFFRPLLATCSRPPRLMVTLSALSCIANMCRNVAAYWPFILWADVNPSTWLGHLAAWPEASPSPLALCCSKVPPPASTPPYSERDSVRERACEIESSWPQPTTSLGVRDFLGNSVPLPSWSATTPRMVNSRLCSPDFNTKPV